MTQSIDQEFVDRLNQHPKLRARMESLLNVVENVAGDCTKTDDAEQHRSRLMRFLRHQHPTKYIRCPA